MVRDRRGVDQPATGPGGLFETRGERAMIQVGRAKWTGQPLGCLGLSIEPEEVDRLIADLKRAKEDAADHQTVHPVSLYNGASELCTIWVLFAQEPEREFFEHGDRPRKVTVIEEAKS
jgi:hypothetical protein